tara:strand:+ start:608 stop:805 length:198 start_codon:yes stop_codon:yes gene_type:complete
MNTIRKIFMLNETSLTQVIEALIEKYPNTLPSKILPLDELGRLIGQQDAIKYLVQHLEGLSRKGR